MNAALAERLYEEPPQEEQRIVLKGIPWEVYDAMRTALDDRPSIRMAYLKGVLEIMSPSPLHDYIKTSTARLLERYLEEKDIPMNGYGSTTFKAEALSRGIEPDECYVFGELREAPDIAIEVVVRHGGVNRLEIHRGLGVPEVWIWKDGAFSVYRLRGERYEQLERSEFLPELDLALLAEYAAWPDQLPAVKAFLAAVRAR